MRRSFIRKVALTLGSVVLLAGCNTAGSTELAPAAASQISPTAGQAEQAVPHPRHEAGFIALRDTMYLIGSRGMKPVDIYDPQTRAWTSGATPPVEMHHFQPVVVGEEIWIVGAMTGPWPDETPLDRIWRYIPAQDVFLPGPEIPAARRRGGGGAVHYGGRIWWTGGIVNGHRSGTVAWLDSFDVATGTWRTHPDSPTPRDHFQAAITDNRLYAIGGRVTDHDGGLDFERTIARGDIYNIGEGRWLTGHSDFAIPTPRAGGMTAAIGGRIVVAGGESGSQLAAHNEVDAFDPVDGGWSRWPDLAHGRHGSGLALLGDEYVIASGAGNRGGEPELESVERSKVPALHPLIAQANHTVTLDFIGPDSSEDAEVNPFTDYRLVVTFRHERADVAPVTVRGFYAGDGDAADSSADAGNIWRTRYTPQETGRWTWKARLASGRDIAIDPDEAAGEIIPLAHSSGTFEVTASTKSAPDFRAADRGRLVAHDGRLKFAKSGEIWLKTGTNSPENLLAFEGIDGTYRMGGNARDGEADSGSALHRFAPHIADWREGDPLWRDGQGRGLIGAVNYLADSGVNAAYFLTWNVGGDGKDVWPFLDPEDPTRFDVSKLAQWERIFAHMQARGIALHIVLQETENELVMDGGDTGRIRKLYMAEMVARFAHHNALFWNLGEENGPVHWRPEGQDDAQRRAMVDYLSLIDAYDHPLLLHTHSESADKDAIAGPLVGYPGLDGLSLQVSDPADVWRETKRWQAAAREAGQPWVTTMDEIGPWQDGAIPDAESPDHHATLRQQVLWGHLLAGGSGVEWYFGAHHPHNDLTAEDFRSRDDLWRQSRVAREILDANLALAEALPCPDETTDKPCLTGPTAPGGYHVAILYLEAGEGIDSVYRETASLVRYLDPLTGDQVAADNDNAARIVILELAKTAL